jgi:hypothetical protein
MQILTICHLIHLILPVNRHINSNDPFFTCNRGHLQYVHTSSDPSYGASSSRPDGTPSGLPNGTPYGTSYGTPVQMEFVLIVMDVYP